MNGWWIRCAVTALVVVATTTLIARRAVSDDCLHVCAETDKDDRGCCPAAKPKTPPKVPPKTQPKVPPKTQPKATTRLDIGGDASVAGARLTIDGQPRGNAPTMVETVPGRHLVELAKDRFEPHAQWVEVAAGQTKIVTVTLKATTTKPPPTVAAQSAEVPAIIKLIETQPADMDRSSWKEKRRDAARKLVQIKDQRAVPVLIKLAETEPFDIVGEIATEGLGNLGDQSAVPVLQKIANDPARDKSQRELAAKALVKLGAQVAQSVGGCPNGMVHVPGGTFTMGSADVVGSGPAHPVTLGGYCLDKTEVTVAAYGACVGARKCGAGDTTAGCNGGVAGKQDHPINCVDWNQATAYCTWASKRLPTEAEWEHAARGDDGRMYPWGNEEPSSTRLNWKSEHGGTTAVGAVPAGASPFGALDLAGNVWEWTADIYYPYAAGAATNPTGGTRGSDRVNRGGGWLDIYTDVVSGARRYKSEPARRSADLGFRCARGN